MKLEKILIENFRGIRHLELDFQDELERVQDVVPVVGPNTSGKTSILDAITLCLGPSTEIWTMRPDLVYSPASLVRRGSVRAHVACTVRFSDAELAAVGELFGRIGSPDAERVPNANRVTVEWEYPDPTDQHERGLTRHLPNLAYLLFKGRKAAIRHFHVPGVGARSLEALGGIFLFDQKRTGLGQRSLPRGEHRSSMDSGLPERTRDPRKILIDLATRAQATQDAEATEREAYARFCELYARVCKPHSIKGLINTESGLDMEFEGPQGTYLFDGQSSGQIMLISLLLQFARNRIHQSIILIDELELHLHPLWQTRLYTSLGDLGTQNQIFFTTHSTHLRELLRGTVFHATGDLGEAVKKEEA